MNNRCPLNVKLRSRSLQKLNTLFAVTYGSQNGNQIQITVWEIMNVLGILFGRL